VRLGSSIADAERRLIQATLEHCEEDKKRAAEILGISLKTLYHRLNAYRGA
jgi:DNA-binding NtrC family response regulator